MDYILESDILVRKPGLTPEIKKYLRFFYTKKISVIKLQYNKGVSHYIKK